MNSTAGSGEVPDSCALAESGIIEMFCVVEASIDDHALFSVENEGSGDKYAPPGSRFERNCGQRDCRSTTSMSVDAGKC